VPTLESEKWLQRVFAASGTEALISAYDDWAGTYDADMLSLGYLHPAVVAGLVGRYVPNLDAPILDAGVGTGILGEILSVMGYSNLVGVDISEQMLARARDRNVYRELRNRVLGEVLDFADARFGAIISTGVFTVGHAPPSAFDELARIVRPKGYLIFTVGTLAWEHCGFQEKIKVLEADGRCHAVEATKPYRPMPFAQTEGALTAQAFVYGVGARSKSVTG